MATFSEIPFEVFISALLPCLSVADVGMLAQVDTMWRDFIENPLVWKTLYLHLTPGKILDTSVHIGPKSARVRDRDREYQIFRNTGVQTLQYLSGEPFVPQSTKRCKGSKWFLHHTWCCNCMPKDLKNTLKSWREIRTDGIQSDDFVRNQIYPNTYNTSEYCSYVRSQWMEYNQQRGLSTVNLCQNPEHYSIDTLGVHEDCKNKKSFKKATIKIFEKKKKTALTKAAREKRTKLKRLEKALLVIKQLELEYLEADKAEKQATEVFNRISTAAKRA